MGNFQIPVSWYRDETMLHLMDKNRESIGVYVLMISWCSDNKSYGDIPYAVFRYVLGGEDTMENLQTMCRSCNSRKGNRVDVVQGG